jgi:TRAP transporter 4TM/12TM fusion protein
MSATTTVKGPETSESSQLPLDSIRDLWDPRYLIALCWTISQICFVIFPGVDTFTQRALHVGFALSLGISMLAPKAGSRTVRLLYLGASLLSFLPSAYIAYNSRFLTTERIQGLDAVTTLDYVLGIGLIVALLWAGKRILGAGMIIFASLFIVYFFAGPYLPDLLAHRYTGWEKFIDSQFLSMHGIFGTAIAVSTQTVFYFILFAAIYDTVGGGRFIIDLAFAVTGRSAGGPAKAAVVSSGMLGSVSGSAVANVMSTGIFTIPLMKKAGYPAKFAGAVEAAASTGGQLVPPIMGAAAFIMADFLQTPYKTIVLAAIMPALLYYIALLFMVDLKSRQMGLRPAHNDDAISLRETLGSRGHLLLPLGWLVYRIVSGHSIEAAALEGCALSLIVGVLRPATRTTPLALIQALVATAERTISVAIPCAVAGIVVGIIAFSGLGTKFTSLMIWIAGGSFPILLILTMFACLVLGTGMPTTSAYIMAAILLAPALVTLGAQPLAAHFFIFYFAILSMVTPPVALAAYAAASISRASPNETGWLALAASFPGFLIPFAVIIHPGLLWNGDHLDMAWGFINSLLGFAAISVAVIGWLFRPLSRVHRGVFLLAGLATLLPDLSSTIGSVAILVGATVFAMRPGKQKAAE